MSDFRCYCDATSSQISSIELPPHESHHLVATCRAREGDEVIAFNGQGIEWTCTLSSANKRQAILTPKSHRIHDLPSARITLYQAAPKAKGLESIVRRSTELGVWTIQPLVTERTELKVISERENHKLSKLHASAIEGAKQSGNPFIPEIGSFNSIDSISQDFDLKLVASLQPETTSIRTAFERFFASSAKSNRLSPTPSNPLRIACLIGPEGDFSPSEYERINQLGFKPVSLGPYVLRCETAAVSILSAIQQQILQP